MYIVKLHVKITATVTYGDMDQQSVYRNADQQSCFGGAIKPTQSHPAEWLMMLKRASAPQIIALNRRLLGMLYDHHICKQNLPLIQQRAGQAAPESGRIHPC